MSRAFASFCALAILDFSAMPAMADPATSQVVVAAPAGPAAPPSDASPDTPPARVEPTADDQDGGADPNDKKIHGEVSVGVGASGYREVSGAMTAPLPNGGQAAIAIDVGQLGPYHR